MLIVIALIYISLMFAVQTMIFRRTSKKIIHMLPLMIIGFVYLTALLLPLADHAMTELGRNDGYMFYSFIASLIAGINTLGSAAVGLAWLIEKV